MLPKEVLHSMQTNNLELAHLAGAGQNQLVDLVDLVDPANSGISHQVELDYVPMITYGILYLHYAEVKPFLACRSANSAKIVGRYWHYPPKLLATHA